MYDQTYSEVTLQVCVRPLMTYLPTTLITRSDQCEHVIIMLAVTIKKEVSTNVHFTSIDLTNGSYPTIILGYYKSTDVKSLPMVAILSYCSKY